MLTEYNIYIYEIKIERLWIW